MMRRRWVAGALVAALAAAACGGDDDGDGDTSGAAGPVELELWVQWSGEAMDTFGAIIDRFEDEHPGITVEVVEGITDPAKVATAIAAGNPPDLVTNFKVENIVQYCGSGTWEDLTPRLEADGLDIEAFPPVARATVTHDGKVCALPYLADSFALYYNADLLAEAGFDEPPRTVSELTEMSKALTQRAADGSIEVAGFVPLLNWYQNYLVRFPMLFDADYFDDGGEPAFASDPDWAALLRWQKELVDFYGYDEISRFAAEAGDEWSAAHAFHQGKLAFHIDGEWRTQMLADLSPELDYGTAPFPVSDDHADRYGAGHVTVGFTFIPDDAEHPDEAWTLARYLATDTDALVEWVNRLQNLPTTADALASPDLDLAPEMQPFLEIYEHPASSFPPAIEAGPVYEAPLSQMAEAWLAGDVDDLDGALAQLDEDVAALIAQG